MLPSTCIIAGDPRQPRGENVKDTSKSCPLCSNDILRQRKLIHELEQIEDKYLGKIHNDAIVRMQYDFYNDSYKQPLRQHGREYVEITEQQIRHHFAHCRVSHERMILDDVQQLRQAQKTLIAQDEYIDSQPNENSLKTWMQLSKHKHDLMRLLAPSAPPSCSKKPKLNTI